MKKLYTCLLLLAQSVYGFAQTTSTFETLPLDNDGYWIGADGSGGFTNGDAYFKNKYSPSPWGYFWETGFAYSNHTNVIKAGHENQYSVYTGSGVGRSGKFAIGKSGSVIELKNAAKTVNVTGFYVANTTYAALEMKNGGYAKKFGGTSGNDADWFQLAITGYRNNAVISDTVKFKLADFTFTDNSKDYILDTWRWVDLRPLGVVDSLIFILTSSDNNTAGMLTPDYFAIDHFNEPLYDVAVIDGSTEAIHKDDVLFKSWGTTCTVTRGYIDIAKPDKGYASFGDPVNGTLKAGVNGVVSLGDNGVAVIEFEKPIKNGTGPDFAVFENGFDYDGYQYLELAFVEVSSDGINYVRFPSVSKTNVFLQTGEFGTSDASLLHNLAGKYVANYGTPFDLEELKNYSQLDLNNITHVKIIDVIGTIDLVLSSKDSLGNPINDPYASTSAGGGFDLDAVGVINQNDLATSISRSNTSVLEIYPNPSSNQFNISLLDVSFVGQQLYVYNVNGTLVENQIITETTILDASAWDNGIYYIRVGNSAEKIIKID